VRAIYVPVTEPVRRALNDLAERECRDPRDQATYLIVQGLKQAGALNDSKTETAGSPATHEVA
jgi:hypothetical protein